MPFRVAGWAGRIIDSKTMPCSVPETSVISVRETRICSTALTCGGDGHPCWPTPAANSLAKRERAPPLRRRRCSLIVRAADDLVGSATGDAIEEEAVSLQDAAAPHAQDGHSYVAESTPAWLPDQTMSVALRWRRWRRALK